MSRGYKSGKGHTPKLNFVLENVKMSENTNVPMMEFLTAFETSCHDGTGYEGCAEKLGLKVESVRARAAKYRNLEYKQATKKVDGKTVYRRAVDGPNGETETTIKADAKLTTQGKPIVIKVFETDKDGKKIVVRPALSLSVPERSNVSRIADKVDEAEALLASIRAKAAEASA